MPTFNFQVIPHPARDILIYQYKLPRTAVSKFLGVSYSYTCSLLSGVITTRKHDKKLWELIELCRKEKESENDIT